MNRPTARLLRRRTWRPTRPFLRRRNQHTTGASSSSSSSGGPTPNPKPAPTPTPTRLDAISARLPPFLRAYLEPLRSAPLSHVSAFLILHELTAVVPLFGLAGLFHYTGWLPAGLGEAAWVRQGVARFERYAVRKGWVEGNVAGSSSSEKQEVEGEGKDEDRGGGGGGVDLGVGGSEVVVAVGDGRGVRIILELGTAWAVTKALLPARLLLSVWATPWFARVGCLPVWNGVRRVFGKGTTTAAAAAAAAGPGSPIVRSTSAGTGMVKERVVSKAGSGKSG
ncbi:hypothetical protein MBLNU459_g1520t1 [Dothideomycetes sp. NU459]